MKKRANKTKTAKADSLRSIHRLCGILKRQRTGPSFAQEMTAHKAEEKCYEQAY